MSNRLPGFSILLGTMLFELIAAPFLGAVSHDLVPVRLFTALVLLAALGAVGVGLSGVVLFIPALVSQLLASYSNTESVVLTAAAFRVLFLGYVIGGIVLHLLRGRKVTLDTIAGAACAYMLIGALWASLYQAVDHLRPGAFNIPDTWLVGPRRDRQLALTYFSFVTLTTVGYGDITPTEPGVGGLCVAEAIVGQLYLAIMIARLVGLHLTQRAD